MSDRCLVSVAVGDPYPELQVRLAASLDRVADCTPRCFWNGRYPPHSPTQEQAQYAFKVHALREAHRRGHSQLLWLDAGVEALKPLGELWAAFSQLGHYFLPNGYRLGNWCSDEALSLLQLTREQAWDIPLITGTVMGFDLSQPEVLLVFEHWERLTAQGAMNGAHINAAVADRVMPVVGAKSTGTVSTDWRVYGHRHDESVLSALIHRAGLSLADSELCSSSRNVGPQTILAGRGIRPRPVE